MSLIFVQNLLFLNYVHTHTSFCTDVSAGALARQADTRAGADAELLHRTAAEEASRYDRHRLSVASHGTYHGVPYGGADDACPALCSARRASNCIIHGEHILGERSRPCARPAPKAEAGARGSKGRCSATSS